MEGEIQILREQSDVIEEVVDEVVHSYHSGFNKAIQNYSQVGRMICLIDIWTYVDDSLRNFLKFKGSFLFYVYILFNNV